MEHETFLLYYIVILEVFNIKKDNETTTKEPLFRKRLAINLPYLRQENNLSQEELAEKLGSSSSYISQIENAKKNVTSDFLDKLAYFFEIDPTELVANRPEKATKRIKRIKSNDKK